MSSNFDEVMQQALSLPEHERETIAWRLWESVGGQIDDEELVAEFERRCAEVDSGQVETLSADQVMRDIREALKKKS